MKIHTNLIIGIAVTALLGMAIGLLTLAPLPAIGPVSPKGSDKLYHLLVFAALATPLPMASPRLVMPVILAATAYGGLIEVVQPFVGRAAEWQDFGANIIGAIVGAGLGSAVGLGFGRSRNDDDQSLLKPVKASG